MIIETALIDMMMDDPDEEDTYLNGSPSKQYAEALAKILKRIRPFLESATYGIAKSCTFNGQLSSKPEISYFDERGLVLIDTFSELYSGSGSKGDYLGSRLILFRDGRLVHVARKGKWNQQKGEISSWEIINEEELGLDDAIKRYGFKEIIKGLTEQLKGKKTKEMLKLKEEIE
jgi:hypothetical protein